MAVELVLRPAERADLPAVAELFLAVRAAAVPTMPPVRDPSGPRSWVDRWDLDAREVWLAEADRSVNDKANLRRCFECHKPNAQQDFLFSFAQMKGAK